MRIVDETLLGVSLGSRVVFTKREEKALRRAADIAASARELLSSTFGAVEADELSIDTALGDIQFGAEQVLDDFECRINTVD